MRDDVISNAMIKQHPSNVVIELMCDTCTRAQRQSFFLSEFSVSVKVGKVEEE